jgi:hypothetical protein
MNNQVTSINMIIPGIYIGNYASSKLDGFDLVINCTHDMPNNPSNNTIRVPVFDPGTSIYKYQESVKLYKTMNKIMNHIIDMYAKGGNILFHCYAGQQRSCAACFMFISKLLGDDMAFKLIKKNRTNAFHNHISFEPIINGELKVLDIINS